MEFLEWFGLTAKVKPTNQVNTTVRRGILAIVQGFFVVTVFFGCGNKNAPTDTPTAGEIAIAVDESFQPVIQAEVEAFMANYKYAKINASYLPETQSVNLLLRDSVRLVVMTRELQDNELTYFQEKKIKPRIIKIAKDGVAIIVNRRNPDSLLTMDQLTQIFKGQTKNWRQVQSDGSGLDKEVVTVFDNSNSSNLSYIKKRFGLSNELDNRIFAAKSNQQVVDYVQQNEGALGIIGVNWISDREDAKQKEFTERISVVAVADTVNPSADDYYKPLQAYLALKKYPLSRDLFIISREARAGLGTGFIQFVTGDKGQTVILKAGLLPVTMPIRLVQLTK